MMRLIDADKLLADIKTLPIMSNWGEAFMLNLIKEQPIIDAVPVVRCKDCKYLMICNNKALYAICGKTGYGFKPFDTDTRDHFCAFGERDTEC